MNWTFTLVDKIGTAVEGEMFLDTVTQGAFVGLGADVLVLDNDQHEIKFVPTDSTYNTYITIIPAGYGDSILTGDPEITIIFQEITDFEPICNFSILPLACSSDVLVLYTVAASIAPTLTWNFGDGSVVEITTLNYLVHKYQSFNTYTITLNVEICHDEVLIDEDGCPCRNTSIQTYSPVAEEVNIIGDVHYYEIPIDYFYRGNCCQDLKINLTIYVNGIDEGTSYGGITLSSTAIDELDVAISFNVDFTILSIPVVDQFVIKGDSINEACNQFAIPLVFNTL